MKSKFGDYVILFEKVFTVLSILWITGGVDIKFLAFIAYPSTVFFLLVGWKETIWKSIQEYFFWIYIGFMFISTAWAADFGASLYMNLKFIGTLLIGLSLGIRYSTKEQLRILAWSFGIAAILSIFYCLFLPQKGIMVGGELQGAWRGIYGHKNQFGRTMVISTMIFLLQAIACKQYKFLMWSGVVFSFALVILSNSATALVIVLTLLAIFPLYRALRWSYSWLIPFLSIVIISISVTTLFFLTQFETILTSLGKDVTLTGRIPLWELLVSKMISQRPWFGYGYGGFWTGWNGESGKIWRIETWEPPSAHNGLLDIWLSIGLLGVILAVIVFVNALIRSISYLRSTRSVDGLWPLWFLTLLVLTNITESTLDSRSIIWAFYSAVVISTHRKTTNIYNAPDIQS
ncbi:MAG: O-antigen ligase family protein [Cyanobacteria bacterium P01_A01_bin.83]